MHMPAESIARLQTMTLQMGHFLAAYHEQKRGAVRHREWLCLCSNGTAIRSAELPRCSRCGASRPNTVPVDQAVAEARVLVEALGEFHKISDESGQLTALREVIRKYRERIV